MAWRVLRSGRGRRALGAVAAAGSALVAAPAATATISHQVVKPPELFAKALPRVKAKSGLKVLLPSKIDVDVFSARAQVTATVPVLGHGHYRLRLEDRRDCRGQNACLIGFFVANATSDVPGGRIHLARGRRGTYDGPQCLGGGCTPPRIFWIERHTLYSIELRTYRAPRAALISYANSAIVAGPR